MTVKDLLDELKKLEYKQDIIDIEINYLPVIRFEYDSTRNSFILHSNSNYSNYSDSNY